MKVLQQAVVCTAVLLSVSGCTSISHWFNGLSDNKVPSASSKPVISQPSTNKNSNKKSAEQQAFNSQFSGYLVDYTDMKENRTATGGTSLLWVSPELKKGKYDSIIIDPIGLYPRPPLLAKVSKGRMLEALTYIKMRAVSQLGSTLKIVDKPGPTVLRLDAAITGVKTPADKDKLHDAKNTPVSMIFVDASPTAAQQDQAMVVFLEARLRDSQSNKVLVKAVRAGTGNAVGKDKVTVDQMKPLLNSWVQDADVFIRKSVK